MKNIAQILNEVMSLEAYFKGGLERATGLRKELERVTSPTPRKGISEQDEARIIANRRKRLKVKK